MKKLIFLFSILFSCAVLKAAVSDEILVGKSSYTITNDGPVLIVGTKPGNVLDSVIIASTSATGTLKIYDSSNVATNQVANISLANTGNYQFTLKVSSGITYTTTNNTSGLTIIWKQVVPAP